MGRLFGTDGVRGLANGDLTPELALSVAVAAARVLVEADSSHQPLAIVGRDPRASGEMLEAAVVAGLTSAGADVLRAGVLPTPAVAYLVSALGADVGVMISASHNPMPDNGIKLFAAGGHKLPDAVEDEIEQKLDERDHRPTGAGIGRVRDIESERLHGRCAKALEGHPQAERQLPDEDRRDADGVPGGATLGEAATDGAVQGQGRGLRRSQAVGKGAQAVGTLAD